MKQTVYFTTNLSIEILQGALSRYHEIGRAVATVMSDEIFHDVAYKAMKRDHLLAGLDEFLDAVTVLPPGEWDPSIRIEPPSNVSNFINQSLARVVLAL